MFCFVLVYLGVLHCVVFCVGFCVGFCVCVFCSIVGFCRVALACVGVFLLLWWVVLCL